MLDREASCEQGGPEVKGVPGAGGVIIEHSGAAMVQETKVEQRDRERGGRVELDKSAEEEGRVVAGRRCGD